LETEALVCLLGGISTRGGRLGLGLAYVGGEAVTVTWANAAGVTAPNTDIVAINAAVFGDIIVLISLRFILN
jgi:hypothetical protein